MPLDISAAGWTAIASASTLIITGSFALWREKVIHRQTLKKEVFLRKLECYESNIVYNTEGLKNARELCTAIKKLCFDYNTQEAANFRIEQEEKVKKFNDLTSSIARTLYSIQLYSTIQNNEIAHLDKNFKEVLSKLSNFPSHAQTLGLPKAKEIALAVFDELEMILDKMEKHFDQLFKQMHNEIERYL